MNTASADRVIEKSQYVLKPHNLKRIKMAKANRTVNINDPHVRKIAANMREYGFNSQKPIIIGPDNIIRAGHNRFLAATLAGVEIVVEIETNDKMTLIEHTKQDDIVQRWSTKDFIRLFAKKGKKSYQDLQAIIKSYESFPVKVVIASAGNFGNQASGKIFTSVRNGNFCFAKDKNRRDVEHELDEIQELHDLIQEDSQPTNGISMHVGLAYLWLKMQDNFNKEWFNKNVARNTNLLIPQMGGSKTNRKMLVAIYNKGLRKPNRLTCE